MEQRGIEAFRSDHLRDPGKITDQMFSRILGDDLCIAVVTGHNPNVFYEIAIAQAAGRPLILLAERGELMPFDLHDQRFVEYTMKPSPLVDGVYVKGVVDHIDSLEAANWEVTSPFDGIVASGGDADAGVEFLPQAHSFGSANEWMGILAETEHAFDIMGISLSSWRKSPGFAKAVKDKAAAGCEVRILLMHPENPALPELINDAIEEDRLGEVQETLVSTFRSYSKLSQQCPGIAVRQISRGCPHFQIAITDSRATCIPYMYSRRSSLSPLIACRPDHAFYAAMVDEFNDLWTVNASSP
ncbi:MAG: hypothetical protein QOH60_2145 [Mycobacterium sp.]|jgi:hypothetical protein|nr:hypothetical protein [Mycobacterium sp.]